MWFEQVCKDMRVRTFSFLSARDSSMSPRMLASVLRIRTTRKVVVC